MARHALSVIAPQGRVGTLVFESAEDRYEFAYDPEDIAQFIFVQAERLIRIAPEVPKVDPELL